MRDKDSGKSKEKRGLMRKRKWGIGVTQKKKRKR